jgi:hypothetical protein
VSPLEYFLTVYKITSALSLHAIGVFKLFCCLVEENIKYKYFASMKTLTNSDTCTTESRIRISFQLSVSVIGWFSRVITFHRAGEKSA